MAPKINVKDRFTDGEIDLSMSDLEEVPIKDIALLKKAYSLDLSNNRLTVLPKHFPTLIHITVLDLSKNELKELPEDFGNLTKLRHLDLYQNHLQHLPLSFSKLKDLKWLDLKDNPLVPTVAKVAGPCLDTKQCQNCARDVVNFFMKLEQQVNSELENRNRTRQKQLELNQQKKQEEKKNKKKEKQKQRQEAVVTQKTSLGKVKSKKENNKKTNEVAVKREERSAFRSIFIGLLLSTILLFILTSIKLEVTKSFELYTVRLYEKGLEKLPAGFRDYGVQGGQLIHNFHKKTGNITLSAIKFINYHVISEDKYTEFVKKFQGLIDYVIEKFNDIYNILVLK